MYSYVPKYEHKPVPNTYNYVPTTTYQNTYHYVVYVVVRIFGYYVPNMDRSSH